MIYMLPPCRSYLLISYTICCPLRGLAGQFFYSMYYPQKSLSDIQLVEGPRWLHLCIWCPGRDGYKAGLSWNGIMYGISSVVSTGYVDFLQDRSGFQEQLFPQARRYCMALDMALAVMPLRFICALLIKVVTSLPRFKERRCRPHLLDRRNQKICSFVLEWPLFFDLMLLFSP